jgi:hypothetical protein
MVKSWLLENTKNYSKGTNITAGYLKTNRLSLSVAL